MLMRSLNGQRRWNGFMENRRIAMDEEKGFILSLIVLGVGAVILACLLF